MSILNVCNKYRMVLTDVLPYETPLLFDNYGFYTVLIDDQKRNIFTKQFDSWEKRKDEKKWYIPFNYSARHYTSGKSRLLSIMHPMNQLKFVDFYEKNAKYLLYLCSKSPFSIRHISNVAKCKFEKKEENEIDDIAEYDERQVLKNFQNYYDYENYNNIYKFYDSIDLVHLEAKYKYCMTLDLAKCFYNIYTHSISWAVKGKEYAKNNRDTESLEEHFDNLMQKCNYDETNGIVVGPEVSRIFAEIILQKIDLNIMQDLKNEKLVVGKDYDIRRYVDDSFVFINNLNYAELIKKIFEKRCEQYKLYLNEKKIKIFAKPFVTDITVAKRDVKSLMTKIKERYFNRNEDGNYEKKFKDSIQGISFFSKEFGVIAHRNHVEYGDICRYCLSLIKKRLKMESSRENAIPSEGQLLSFIEISFFVFSLDMCMSNSVKMSKIIDILVNWSEKLEDKFQRENVLDRLCREFKRCVDVYIATSLDDQTNIEILNILLVLYRKINYDVSDEMLNTIFKLDGKDPLKGGYEKLNYFQICGILYLIENKKPEILGKLIDEVKRKFKIKNPLYYSELMLLYFDILSCPYIDKKDKLDIIQQIFGNRDGKRLKEVQNIGRWFFDWDKNKNISYIIEKKEYIPAYR